MSVTHVAAPPGTPQIMITRRFAAPRALVYRAYTEPDLLVRWWGMDEHSTRVDRYELRDGGRWRLVSTDGEGVEHGFHGVFHGDPAPAGFVQTFEYEGVPGRVSLDTYRFTDHGTETTVESLTVFQSTVDRDDMVAEHMEYGARESARRLADLLTELG